MSTDPYGSRPPAAPERVLLARALRGDAVPWPTDAPPGFERRFLEACGAEGIGPLLHHELRRIDAWPHWPAAIREPLAQQARIQAAVDMLRERELIAVLDDLAAAGIETLLLKGTPLAYTHYPEPALRTRCDTDVLVRPEQREAAAKVLEAHGYRHPNAVSGELVSYEQAFCRTIGTIDHVVDLHWQVNNGQVFARALTWDEAWPRAVPVPPLGSSARALCQVHALLLACMHRAAHLGVDGSDAERPIWLYDIHLIAQAMSPDEWREFAAWCAAHDMRRIGADALVATRREFATRLPEDVERELPRAPEGELSARYLDAGRGRVILIDLRALPRWRDRAALVREWLFPPADYVLAKYHARRRWLLPWLYLRRAAGGMRRRARPASPR